MSHVWMVTCTNSLAKAKLVNKAELCVKGHRCIVIDPDTRDVKLKLLWLPVHMESKRIEEALAPYGTVRSIVREKWSCPGMEQMETLNKEVTLTLREGMNSTQIPHQLTVFGCRSLVIVPGRPPLCLRCNRIGHIRRECRIPRCGECRRYGHSTDECASTYADKLRQGRAPLDDVVQDHLMDISEMVDATGEVIDSVAPSTERETTSQEAETTNPVSQDVSSEPTKEDSTTTTTATMRNWSEDEYPLLKVTVEPSCSQQPQPRRERSTTSGGASVKRPAPKAESSQPSGMGAKEESKNDEGGEEKRKPAALREDPYSMAPEPDNAMKDNDVLPT
ncbi:uncharacterized protein LOC115325147 [Ixodes scapularis]|uniref:uncharacterized protein LOC115325147 n=1 Tax=Ixodes scapularis TaxID=6945 RepID=UPI001A9EAD65|nr:uncharacterized protein LOC115325147 [Ixodes scapularis]